MVTREAVPVFGASAAKLASEASKVKQPTSRSIFFWGGQRKKAIMNIITKYGSKIQSVAFSCLALVALTVFGSPALAQSSGNFAAAVQTTQCTMNTEGGLPNSGALNNNGGGMLLNTFIKTPNSQFTTLLITPSLVTGLFTNTAITQDMTSSAQTAAVRVY